LLPPAAPLASGHFQKIYTNPEMGQNDVLPANPPNRQNRAADFQRADFFFGKWKIQIDHGRIPIQTLAKARRTATAKHAKYANGF
jgi:hypothetical protein